MISSTKPTTTRYHGLDALRAFAMIMGVVLHAALLYADADLAYEVTGKKDTPTSETLFTHGECRFSSYLLVFLPDS